MRVAVVDVGSNTVRLLVAWSDGRTVQPLEQVKHTLRLGATVEEHGRIPVGKLAETADCVRALVTRARRESSAVEVLVTSPGRQAANGDELVGALERAARVPVHVLSAEEEGRLAFEGALSSLEDEPSTLAVCDVGGGSTQIVVGTPEDGPVWFRSIDIGSMRLTSRLLTQDPPAPTQLEAAAAEVSRLFAGVTPPVPQLAIAVGGSARGVRKLNGASLDAASLADVLQRLARRPSPQIAASYGLALPRARTLAAGTLILSEVQRRIGLPMRVGRSGLRDGAVLTLARRAAAA